MYTETDQIVKGVSNTILRGCNESKLGTQTSRILRVARILVSILAIVLTLIAVYVLIVGQQVTIVQEGLPGEINDSVRNPEIQRVPYPPAFLFLLAPLLLLIGNVRHIQWLTWGGLGTLLLFSLLFLFSFGAAILPIVLVILILLLVIHWVEKAQHNRQDQ
ncbi:MAG: hypothetical protein DWG76_07350 [Chloroflexi bacterium]|nr:hypothetical protein [Chloroflexota bacterium]